MICPNCKQEIATGSIYCEHCGETIQIVPDYNALDDVLPSILEDKPKAVNKQLHKEPSSKKETKTCARNKTTLRVVIAAFAVLLISIVLVSVAMYRSSYTYYMKQATKFEEAKDYSSAQFYYGVAVSSEDTVEARLGLGRMDYRLGQFEEAKKELLAVVSEDSSCYEAFEILCKIYEADRDYYSIEELATYTKDEKALEIINSALILPPSFSEKGGKYDDDIVLYLSAPKNQSIYYSVDGTNPEDGLLYDNEKGIYLSDGVTTVRAVCVTEDGKFGFEAKEEYKISYKAPGYPTVSPMNGTFHEETYITITAENEEDRIFYTWDGSTPTVDSAEYTEPIVVPEGNNILSIIVINRHDLISEVLQCNYIYKP